MHDTSPRIVRDAEVRAMTGLSRVQRWRLERAGKFPVRVNLSERSIGWYEADILAWLASRPRGLNKREAA